MSFKNAQDLVASNALNLSNTMRITKNDTDLRWSQTLLRKLADVLLNILSRHLEPTRWSPLVCQCLSLNTFSSSVYTPHFRRLWRRFESSLCFRILAMASTGNQ